MENIKNTESAQLCKIIHDNVNYIFLDLVLP